MASDHPASEPWFWAWFWAPRQIAAFVLFLTVLIGAAGAPRWAVIVAFAGGVALYLRAWRLDQTR